MKRKKIALFVLLFSVVFLIASCDIGTKKQLNNEQTTLNTNEDLLLDADVFSGIDEALQVLINMASTQDSYTDSTLASFSALYGSKLDSLNEMNNKLQNSTVVSQELSDPLNSAVQELNKIKIIVDNYHNEDKRELISEMKAVTNYTHIYTSTTKK